MKNLILGFVIIVTMICCHVQEKKENVLLNIARWEMYKGFFRQEQILLGRDSCAYTFGSEYKNLRIRSPLLLNLTIDSIIIQGDTSIYVFSYFYNQKECISLCADYPYGVGLVDNKFRFYLQDKRKSRELCTQDSLFITYIKDHKAFLNPWLLQEAEQRGVFKKK